jgi:hypothetical protein
MSTITKRQKKDLRRAIELRAEGKPWPAIAKLLKRKRAQTVREWPRRYFEYWQTAQRENDIERAEQTANETVYILREMFRTEAANDKIKSAAQIIKLLIEKQKIELKAMQSGLLQPCVPQEFYTDADTWPPPPPGKRGRGSPSGGSWNGSDGAGPTLPSYAEAYEPPPAPAPAVSSPLGGAVTGAILMIGAALMGWLGSTLGPRAKDGLALARQQAIGDDNSIPPELGARLMDPFPAQLTRRQVLRLGTAGIAGLTLPSLLKAEAERNREVAATADACIVIFLDGGPSHHDMWDMKPEAPAEIRGEFKPISSSVPGLQISEHLPRMAKVMHRATLVRSMHHSVNNAHAAAVYAALTGHDRGEQGGGAKPTDHPAIGSVMGLCRPPKAPVVPFVSMPYITQEGAGGPPQPGFFGGWLGRAHDPLFIRRDPNATGFGMPELSPGADVTSQRMDERKQLVANLGGGVSKLDRQLQDMEAFQAKAFDLLTSEATRRAFQIEREPIKVRESYGRNIYGQSVLLARRLIEAGTRAAYISWAPDANATWDTHGNNFKKLKGELLPQLDMAVASLLDDLEARGLLERTVVAIMGDFGRSPKINPGAGRDHWNFCYSLTLAGGGFKKGYVHGASDRIGGRPSLNPLGPADIIATIYRALGIPHDLELRDRLQRPFVLCPWGDPVGDLLG